MIHSGEKFSFNYCGELDNKQAMCKNRALDFPTLNAAVAKNASKRLRNSNSAVTTDDYQPVNMTKLAEKVESVYK